MNNNNNNNINNNMNNNIYNNNINNNINNNSQQRNNLGQNGNNGEPIPVIDRSIKDFSVNEFKYMSQQELNSFVFHASSGLRVIITVPKYYTIKQLLRFYAKKIGVGEGVLGKDIYFFFNAILMDINEERTIYDYFDKNKNNITITVIDRNNVIGAEIIV